MSSCIMFLSLLSGITFNFLQIENGMTLEDAHELTKQLCMFLLKNSNVNWKGGTKRLPLLSKEKAFTFVLFIKFVGGGTSPRLVLVIGASIDFKAYNIKSFCWGTMHISMADRLAFNLFKSSTML